MLPPLLRVAGGGRPHSWRHARVLRRLPAVPDRPRHLRIHSRRDAGQLDDGRRQQRRHDRRRGGRRPDRICRPCDGGTSSGSRSSAPASARSSGHVAGRGSGPAIRRCLVIAVALVGAIGAMVLQRYVIIVGTAFGGAWTIIVGAVNALRREESRGCLGD